MDAPLRNGLWNCVDSVLRAMQSPNVPYFSQTRTAAYGRRLWHEFFGWRVDEMPVNTYTRFVAKIRDWFMATQWYRVYDLLEFIAKSLPMNITLFEASCDLVLERELAGYRFVGAKIVPIVSSQELDEVERAITTQPAPVRTHIDGAVALLSDRKNPNYRKSIDESISAVEAAVRELTGNTKALLPAGLKALDANLHPSQEQAFIKLYGYTSDDSGIRHALTDESRPVDAADARYMLVACSAFVNYLRSKAKKELP